MTLKKTKTPDQTKRLFTNYVAHINYLESELDSYVKSILNAGTTRERYDLTINRGLERFTFFQNMRDAHDCLDVALEALILTPFFLGMALGSVMFLIFHGLKQAGITAFDDIPTNPERDAFLALTFLAASLQSVLNGLLSLIVRPIMTLIQGWNNEADSIRFHYKDGDVPAQENTI